MDWISVKDREPPLGADIEAKAASGETWWDYRIIGDHYKRASHGGSLVVTHWRAIPDVRTNPCKYPHLTGFRSSDGR